MGNRRWKQERYVAGRRAPSPQEDSRKKEAHACERESHQANGGGLNWLITLQGTDPKKAKQKQQTTPAAMPLRSLNR
jgi:hypothetical protein